MGHEPSVPVDRYYNVLAFVVVVPLGGVLADRCGRLSVLYAGVSAVGLALVLFQLPPGWGRYLGTQTAIQIGWAFLDLYVWVMAADLVFEHNRGSLQNAGVAVFLLGTVAGAAFTLAFPDVLVCDGKYFLWIVPLFAAVALTGGVVRRHAAESPPRAVSPELRTVPSSVAVMLTEREQEIASLLVGGKTNREICDALHISQNTLKTHCRHVYRKVGVGSRVELRQLARLDSESA